MPSSDEVGQARTKWRQLKDACAKAGAPKDLFGSDDLGPELDKMQAAVAIVEKGSKVTQDERGKKALEKARTDGRAAADKVSRITTKYRERADQALQKAMAPALKTALRDAVAGLTRCQTIASGTAKML